MGMCRELFLYVQWWCIEMLQVCVRVDYVSSHIAEIGDHIQKFAGRIFGSLMYRIMPSTNRDSWTYSFSVCTPLIFFSCLLHQCFKHNAETEWESGQHCHAHDLSGIASGSSPFRMMLAVNSSQIAFIMLRSVPNGSILSRTFIMKACLMLSETF